MAKRGTQVSEDKLQKLIENWNTKSTGELAEMLGAGESMINYWAGRLRESMKANGMSGEQIRKILPTKRRTQGNVYDVLVKKMLCSEQAPKERGRRAKEVEGPVE